MPVPKKIGLATGSAISGTPTGQADLLAQWMSLVPSYSPLSFRDSSSRPVIYLESHLDSVGYKDILNGLYDARLREIRSSLPSNAIIRWDQEMTGPQLSWRTWGGMDPDLYVRTWRYVYGYLGPMHWCPSVGPDNYEKYLDFWPGDTYVSFAGFDAYDTGKRTPLPDSWRRPKNTIREFTGKRILVGEFGSAVIEGVTGRVQWLKTLRDVEGIWGCIYFDLDMSQHGDYDWTLNPPMRELLYEMMGEA